MFLKIGKILSFFLISGTMFHSMSCIKITIYRYRIVQPHDGIKQCAVLQSGKSDVARVIVYQKTQTCESESQSSARNLSSDDGYAEVTNSASTFKPQHAVEDGAYYRWTIPGGLDIDTKHEARLDVFLPSSVEWYVISLHLSEEPLVLTKFDYKGLTDNTANKTYTVTLFTTYTQCPNDVGENVLVPSPSFESPGKTSFILQKHSLKILRDDRERCEYNLRDHAYQFQTFHYLYVYNDEGKDINLQKIQVDKPEN